MISDDDYNILMNLPEGEELIDAIARDRIAWTGIQDEKVRQACSNIRFNFKRFETRIEDDVNTVLAGLFRYSCSTGQDTSSQQLTDIPTELETIEDYRKAPLGTIVAAIKGDAFMKQDLNGWERVGFLINYKDIELAGARQQVLRWGWECDAKPDSGDKA